ncbi:Gfo/Idh/MocA family oxidoreductase [Bosea sp. LjRoot90]|uniref:Gfo/Idh/MocA family protein n=1 Tax=Bosea sp. LjRoot90 TaxID=3342342 RepID=UPI003ECF2338
MPGAQTGLALIGAGFIAEYHLGGLAAVPEAVVKVVASRSLAGAQQFAGQLPGAVATTDVAAAIGRDDVDAVLVTTPDDTHEAIGALALQAGKAVLLQKPMATSSAACRRLIALADQTGCDLQVSFMHRHFEEVVTARRLIAEGTIGTITSVRMRNATPGPDWGEWFFRRDRVGGGAILQLGIHGIDLIEHLVGEVAAVSARTATLLSERRLRDGRIVPVENPDSAWGIYELANGAIASHEVSMIEQAGCDRFRMEIYGTKGTIWLRSERGALAVARKSQCEWSVPDLPTPPFGQRQHRAWLEGVTNLVPREQTARAGLRGLLVAEAIEQSQAAGGQRVAVSAE